MGRCLTLKTSITTKVICFCRLLKCFSSLSNKQYRPRLDCSYREQSDLGRHCLSLYLTLLNNASKNLQQTTKADRILDDHFADVLRVKNA